MRKISEAPPLAAPVPDTDELPARRGTSSGRITVGAIRAPLAPAIHTHAIADVTGLQTALDGKAATSHTHTESDISGTIAPSKLAQAGASTGQVLKWDGSAWAPAADATGSGVPNGGTTGQLLAKASNADGDTAWVDPPSGGASFDPAKGWRLWTDFVGLPYAGDGHLRLSGTGVFTVAGNALPANLAKQGANGVGLIGNITSGFSLFHTNNNNHAGGSFLAAGTYRYEVRGALSLVPDGTNQATLNFGFGNGGGSGVGNVGPHNVGFRASHTAANWRLVAMRNNTETELNTGVALAANTWVLFVFVFVPGVGVEGFINGTSIGTITTNLPQVGDPVALFFALISASGGTLGRGFYIDYVNVDVSLTAERQS